MVINRITGTLRIFTAKSMIKKFAAVIAGYLVFALSAGLWFPLMGYQPHAAAPAWFELATAAYGVLFSLLAGWLTRCIGRSFTLNYVLAGVMFLGAGLSLLLSGGDHWTQIMTLLLFTPAALFGGMLYKQSKSRAT
jgi:uncharacterized membrane protein YhdT